jgi:hypothetical protein
MSCNSGGVLAWHDRSSGQWLFVDGWYGEGNGVARSFIIDTIDLSRRPCPPNPNVNSSAELVRTYHIPYRDHVFLNDIRIGTQRPKATRLISRLGLPMNIRKASVEVKGRYAIRPKSWLTFYSWDAKVRFDSRNQVNQIDIYADDDVQTRN